MTHKGLYQGKRKFIIIPLLTILFAYFWLFMIGGVLAYFAYKYIPYNSKAKFALIALIALFTLPLGGIWALALTGQEIPVQKNEATGAGVNTSESANAPLITTLTPMAQVTILPKPTATPSASHSTVSSDRIGSGPTATSTPQPTEIVTPQPTVTPSPTTTPELIDPTTTKPPLQNVSSPTPTTHVQQGLTCTQLTGCSEAQYLLNSPNKTTSPNTIACDSGSLNCEK